MLQRHGLKIVSNYTGSRLGMPDNTAIDKLSEKEINFQFSGLKQILSDIFLYLNAACNVTGSTKHV